MTASAAARVARLRDQIRHHDRKYYVEAAPEISDRDYDRLVDELRSLEAKHPELVTPDSPTQRIGDEPVPELTSVRHRTAMLSIDNTYTEADLRAFDERVRKGLEDEKYEYLVDPKVDGVSCSLRYEGGHRLFARRRRTSCRSASTCPPQVR